MHTEISGNLLTSLKQTSTPLNNLFFSEFNQSILQKAIRENIKKLYNIRIDYQNKQDLIALMRVIFIANSANPYGDICSQVKLMNTIVMKKASEQVTTGLSQYYGYIRDINSPIIPNDLPVDVNVYGRNTEINNKIGF